MKLRTIIGAAAVGLAFGAQASAQEDIVIAVAGPITGQLATIGDQFKTGAQAAADAINAAGGVGGRQIKLSIQDDVCDPKQAVSVANRIVAEGIKFIDGHACSGSSIPASAVYAEAGVLMMSPASSNPLLTDDAAKNGWPTIMRLYTRDDAQGAFIGPWIAEKYKGKNVVILHDKSAYGQGVADAVKATMNTGGLNEVMYEGINAGDKDYSALVTKMKELKADVVYFGGYHPEAGLILRQSAEQGFKFQLIMPDLDRLARILAGRRPGRGRHDVRLPVGPAVKTRSQGSGREDQGRRFRAGRLHAVLLRGVQALPRASSAPAATIRRRSPTALKNGTPINTVVGPITFDEKGDIKDATYDINQWHDGKYAPIQP